MLAQQSYGSAASLVPAQMHHSRCSTAVASRNAPGSRPRRAPPAPHQSAAVVRRSSRRGSSLLVCASAITNRQVQVSHILLGEGQEALAAQLKQRIAGGETLAALAAEHSLCPSKSNGGSIGWISRGQTVAEFEEAAFAAPLGAVAVCTSQFGVHVLQVADEREAAEVQAMLAPALGEALAARTAGGGNQDVQYVDVREEGEANIAKLPHFELFPLSKFEEWGPRIAQGEMLDRNRPVVVLCQNGIRSLQFGKWLLTQGFFDVSSVTGGLTAYSVAVDPSIPQY